MGARGTPAATGAGAENVTGGRHNAYAERLAERDHPAPRRPTIIPAWA